jgi:hypothetical protein
MKRAAGWMVGARPRNGGGLSTTSGDIVHNWVRGGSFVRSLGGVCSVRGFSGFSGISGVSRVSHISHVSRVSGVWGVQSVARGSSYGRSRFGNIQSYSARMIHVYADESSQPLPKYTALEPNGANWNVQDEQRGEAAKVPKLATKKLLISGLSRFASRIDAINVLGDLVPELIEPVIDAAYHPTGSFIVTCKTLADAASLMDTIQKNAIDMVRPIKVKQLPLLDYAKLFTTRKAKISMRTVRVEIMNAYCTREDVLFLFRDFRILSVVGLDYLSRNSGVNGLNLFLLDFESAEEAERALQEKIKQVMFVGSVRMLWYNC